MSRTSEGVLLPAVSRDGITDVSEGEGGRGGKGGGATATGLEATVSQACTLKWTTKKEEEEEFLGLSEGWLHLRV